MKYTDKKVDRRVGYLRRGALTLILAFVLLTAALLCSACGGGTQYVRLTFRQGGCEDVVRNIPYGTAATGIPVPRGKAGYTVAWEQVDLSCVTEDRVIYAIETPNTYTVTLDAAGGYCSLATVQATYGFACSLPIPLLSGHTFLGWYGGDALVTDGEIWQRTADVTLTAHWRAEGGETPTTVTVRFVQAGQEDIVRVVERGGSLTDIPSPAPKTGYTVTWEPTDFTAVTEDMVVRARETANIYTIRLDPGGVSDAQIPATELRVTYGARLNLPTPTSETHQFLKWVIRGTDTEVKNDSYTYAQDLELVAVWEGEQWSDLH